MELRSPCHGPPSSDPRAFVGSASWAPDPSGCAGTEHPRSSGCAAPAPTRCGAMVTGISTSAWHWLTPSQHLNMWYELSKEWLQAIIPLPRSVAKELFGLSTDVLPNLNGSNLPVTSNLATGSGLPGRWLLPHFQGMLLGKHLFQLQIVQRASGLPQESHPEDMADMWLMWM